MQCLLLTCLGVIFSFGVSIANAQEMIDENFYQREIQSTFDNRCIACHSCFNAPCQMNLQNYDGFSRGANKLNVYNGLRPQSVAPTRLWVDAQTTREWREKGFFEVNTSKKPEENLFFKMILNRQENPHVLIKHAVASSAVCPDTAMAVEKMKKTPEMAMPYGFPALDQKQISALAKWIRAGAPGKVEVPKLNVKTQNEIRQWEKFLNQSSHEHRLVARYIYEHMFLAHIHFPEDSTQFFKLVRSMRACDNNPQEIATRRPNDDPGLKKFYYCVIPFTGTPVLKTHIPYEWSSEKRARIEKIFFAEKWKVGTLPGYEKSVAENPFIAFADIPSKARYQYLLMDAQYHISTFIKGPVCNGSNAVNSIQEQFYVFFLDPQADQSLIDKNYAKEIAPLLMLPGVFGSEVEIKETASFYKTLIDHREVYRKKRLAQYKTSRPEGYVLNDIWNGEGDNPNASLTVFRHDDNAVVVKGAKGDLSKTGFILDYPLFERLVYNLVVNFDVFGNVSHQLLTRVYMDMIRMEAEELFLSFLPPERRFELRKQWYQGLFAEMKMTYIFPTVGAGEPTGIRYTDESKDTKKQLVEKILFYRMNETVRGPVDSLNWRVFTPPESKSELLKLDSLEHILRPMVSVRAVNAKPFARFFPDLSYLKVRGTNGSLRVFSIIHNKEHENISFILAESLRMAPKEDTLTLFEGYAGSYINMIFEVDEKNLKQFTTQATKLKSSKDYEKFVTKYGVRRTNNEFWRHYDELTTHQKKTQKNEFGYLDLTRYDF